MNILIFGAGKIGKLCYEQCKKRGGIKISAFIDNNRELIGSFVGSIPVISPQDIPNFSFDKIIISVVDGKAISEIWRQLNDYSISKGKIMTYSDFFNDNKKNRVIWLRDFARYAYMESLTGNTAECGVFRGSFARYINKYFHDRKLYLFDTFDGFDKDDLDFEIKLERNEFLKSIYARDAKFFADTSVEQVMCRMPHPHNCIVKQGIFPQTAADVHDSFCLVSLDMDLYLPMLSGLRFFWEKMTPGGVILLHDYFSSTFKSVKQAVEDFEKEIQKNISKAPIGDYCSIALIKDRPWSA